MKVKILIAVITALVSTDLCFSTSSPSSASSSDFVPPSSSTASFTDDTLGSLSSSSTESRKRRRTIITTRGGNNNNNNNNVNTQQTSIPRSTHRHALTLSLEDDDSYRGDSYFNPEERRPPWNPSPQIDETGFLKNSYSRIPGEWEAEVNLGGKYASTTTTTTISNNNYKNKKRKYKKKKHRKSSSDDNNNHVQINIDNLLLQIPVRIRQVPGDGNCLFHSISTCSAFEQNGTHINFNNQDGLRWLYESSTSLRQQAVECLRKRRLLFLQGKEYLRATDLVQAAAAQYGISPEEYCNLMSQDSYWGGGPEIVALCNVLKRPIHVYELASIPIPPPPPPPSRGRTRTRSAAAAAANIPISSSSSYRRGMVDDEYEYHDFSEGYNTYDNDEEEYDYDDYDDFEDEDEYEYDDDYMDDDDLLRDTSLASSSSLQGEVKQRFVLRRMACFGSPKFDSKQPFHILSADSRFPDIVPGTQLKSGNHFLAVFPQHDMWDEIKRRNEEEKLRKKNKKRKKEKLRGGASSSSSGGGGTTPPTSGNSKLHRFRRNNNGIDNREQVINHDMTPNVSNNNNHFQIQTMVSLKQLAVTLWKRFFLLDDL